MKHVVSVTKTIEADSIENAVIELYNEINKGSVLLQVVTNKGALYFVDPISGKVTKSFSEFKNLPIDVVFKAVSKFTGYSKKELANRSRKRELVIARYWFFYLGSKTTHLSLGRLGTYFKAQIPWDHASVLHGKRTIDDLLSTDAIKREEFSNLVSFLRIEVEKHKELISKNVKK